VLGLFLGFSLLTIVEFMEFGLDLLVLLALRCVGKSPPTTTNPGANTDTKKSPNEGPNDSPDIPGVDALWKAVAQLELQMGSVMGIKEYGINGSNTADKIKPFNSSENDDINAQYGVPRSVFGDNNAKYGLDRSASEDNFKQDSVNRSVSERNVAANLVSALPTKRAWP
jgi:hypothetical protein